MLPLLAGWLFMILHQLSYSYLLCHSAVTWSFVWEVLTPLNLYVQVLKRGLKWSPPLKIKPISWNKLICPSSFRSWILLLARGSSSQPVSTFCCTNCNFTFVSGCDIMYMYQYITLCDDFVIFMLECILPRASVLFYLHVLLLSVYTWGYFRPAYVRRSNVSVPSGSGRYRAPWPLGFQLT